MEEEDDGIELHPLESEYCYLSFLHQERRATRAWQPAGGLSPSVRCFEGEFVVYNPLSGQTHYLDIVSGQVLMLVTAGASGTDAICSRIAAFLEVDSDDRVLALVFETLRKLEGVQLIEPTGQ